MTTTEPPGCSTSALPSLAAVLGAHSALRTSRVRDHKLARLLAHGAQENTAFRRTGTARYSFGQISMCMYNVSSDRMQGLIRDRAWTKVGRVSLHPHPPPHPTPRRTLLLEPMSRHRQNPCTVSVDPSINTSAWAAHACEFMHCCRARSLRATWCGAATAGGRVPRPRGKVPVCVSVQCWRPRATAAPACLHVAQVCGCGVLAGTPCGMAAVDRGCTCAHAT